MADINVTITEKEIIRVTISGFGGYTNNHAALSNLDYSASGHQGFQKELEWDDNYKTYLIDHS